MIARRLGLFFGLLTVALPLLAGADRDSGALIAQVPMYFPLATSTPFSITNSGQSSASVAAWTFQETNSHCGASANNELMEWDNNSAAAQTFFCNGNVAISGAYTGNGSGLTGIPYSALPYTAVPLATSSPLVITNSAPVTLGPAWAFNVTSSSCFDNDDDKGDDIAVFANYDRTPILTIPCASTGVASGVVAAGLTVSSYGQGITNFDFPSPIPSPTTIPLPICEIGGSSAQPEQDCRGLVAPTYTTTGYPATSSFHCVYGNVTASSATETLPLTNSAVFGTAPVEVSGVDLTAGTVMPTTAFSSVGTSSISFATTSGHAHYLHLCGY